MNRLILVLILVIITKPILFMELNLNKQPNNIKWTAEEF